MERKISRIVLGIALGTIVGTIISVLLCHFFVPEVHWSFIAIGAFILFFLNSCFVGWTTNRHLDNIVKAIKVQKKDIFSLRKIIITIVGAVIGTVFNLLLCVYFSSDISDGLLCLLGIISFIHYFIFIYAIVLFAPNDCFKKT